MIATGALLGAGVGLGIWITLRAVSPRPAPLGQALAALDRRSPVADVDEGVDSLERHIGRAARRLVGTLGGDLDRFEPDLRVLDRTPARHALDKLVGALGGFTVPLLVWTGLGFTGIRLPIAGILGLSAAAAVAGWTLQIGRAHV